MLHTYTTVNDKIIDVLTETTLGTNGARYRHLDTKERIFEADNPLFVTIERNVRVWGQVHHALRLNRACKRTCYPEVPDINVRATLRAQTRLR